MNNIEDLLYELGISKVTLSKYLGVSRQMIYNYLDSGDINKMPRLKKIKLYRLFGIKSLEDIKNIEVNRDYIEDVEDRLKEAERYDAPSPEEEILDFKELDDENKLLLLDIIAALKKIIEDESDSENDLGTSTLTLKYLLHFIKSIESFKELRYWLVYVSKSFGMTNPNLYEYDEEKQLILESLLFTVMKSYNVGGLSKVRVADAHKRFVIEIEQKNEERLTRTQELNSARIKALQELGYTEINPENAKEVFDKIAEIQSRRI